MDGVLLSLSSSNFKRLVKMPKSGFVSFLHMGFSLLRALEFSHSKK